MSEGLRLMAEALRRRGIEFLGGSRHRLIVPLPDGFQVEVAAAEVWAPWVGFDVALLTADGHLAEYLPHRDTASLEATVEAVALIVAQDPRC